jgi:outer membrane protein TolC
MNARRLALVIALATFANAANAQTSADSLRLPALHAAATATDPRAAQMELLAAQSALRLRNINSDLMPSLSVDGLAQYQSDVSRIGITVPGINIPTPAKDTYDAKLSAQQRIYDPTISPRRAVERAQVAESQARVRTALYTLLDLVNSAFYTALRSQTQIAETETSIADLEAQLVVADARVKENSALPSEANILRAELLKRRQAVAEQQASRRAAIAVLSDLTGKPIDLNSPLAPPDLASETIEARKTVASLRARPEYEQFARSREVLQQTERAQSAQDLPRLSAFGRLGYGRPGLNALSNTFDSYWLGGLQVQWTPWTWGTTARDRQITALQRQIVTTEERAFTAQIDRAIEQDVATIDRLESTLAEDDQIIALRENILSETRARFAEAVITSADYVDRETDVLSARISRALHRVELSQARAHLLTTLGVEVR